MSCFFQWMHFNFKLKNKYLNMFQYRLSAPEHFIFWWKKPLHFCRSSLCLDVTSPCLPSCHQGWIILRPLDLQLTLHKLDIIIWEGTLFSELEMGLNYVLGLSLSIDNSKSILGLVWMDWTPVIIQIYTGRQHNFIGQVIMDMPDWMWHSIDCMQQPRKEIDKKPRLFIGWCWICSVLGCCA